MVIHEKYTHQIKRISGQAVIDRVYILAYLLCESRIKCNGHNRSTILSTFATKMNGMVVWIAVFHAMCHSGLFTGKLSPFGTDRLMPLMTVLHAENVAQWRPESLAVIELHSANVMNKIGAELRHSGDYISIATTLICGSSTMAGHLPYYVTSILNMTWGDIHMSVWW